MPDKEIEIYVVALPGTYVRIEWITATGHIVQEQVVIRPCPDTLPPDVRGGHPHEP